MAASVIGALRVNLGLDSAQFGRGARRVTSHVQTMRRQFLAVAGVAAAFGAAISSAAMAGARETDRVAKAARRLDASVTGYRAVELAAQEAGVGIAGLADAAQTMDREVARGSAGAQRSMSRLSLTAADLAGLDVDERLAMVADRVKDLGLSAGEATALLADLGVRNREMVLLLMQGGDAMRQARQDIREYGLGLSQIDARQIETANDQLGRLGLITRYVGQQLARELVPPLGRMAQAMTDSLREGGRLRAVIDALTGNIRTILTVVGTAVTFFGVRYVGALVAARLATLTLSGSLVVLRSALISTGIGAMIVGAGIMIDQFVKLVTATGGWGEALNALGELAAAVWEGIKTSAGALEPALQAVFFDIQRAWFAALQAMSQGWINFVQSVAGVMSTLPGMGGIGITMQAIAGAMAGNLDELQSKMNGASAAAAFLREQAGTRLASGLAIAKGALDRLRETMQGSTEDTTEAADAARELAAALDDIGGGGGGGAPKAAAEIDVLNSALENTQAITQQVENAFESAFVNFVSGATSARQAAQALLRDLSRLLAQSAFRGLMGAFTGGIDGARAMGGPVSAGGTYVVGERGPELFTPQRSGHIVPNHALGGGGGVSVTLNVDARGSVEGEAERFARYFDGRGREIVQDAVARVSDRRMRGFA